MAGHSDESECVFRFANARCSLDKRLTFAAAAPASRGILESIGPIWPGFRPLRADSLLVRDQHLDFTNESPIVVDFASLLRTTAVPLAEMRIIQYWHSEPPPEDVAALLSTFRIHNPTCRHHVFSRRTAEHFIAQNFSSREVAAFQACAVPAMQADYFRYCALWKLGGIYADADMRCLRPLGPLLERAERAAFFCRPTNNIVTNGFIAAPVPGLPLLRFALDIATFNIESRAHKGVWLATGPGIFSTLYGIHRSGSLEAYFDSLAERPEGFREELRHLAHTVYARTPGKLDELLEGVGFHTISDRDAYVVSNRLAYKDEETHWTSWKGSIYRGEPLPLSG
jgi:hypothetical protein